MKRVVMVLVIGTICHGMQAAGEAAASRAESPKIIIINVTSGTGGTGSNSNDPTEIARKVIENMSPPQQQQKQTQTPRPTNIAKPLLPGASIPVAQALEDLPGASGLPSNVLSVTRVGAGVSFIGAICAWIKMKLLTRKVFHHSLWATWRSDVPFEVLMELSDEEVVKQLWQELRDYYTLEEDDALDAFAIVNFFMEDLYQERSYLRELLWWYKVIRATRLSNLLGDEKTERKAQQHCQRLDFLEDCVHTWANRCLCKNVIVKDYDKDICAV